MRKLPLPIPTPPLRAACVLALLAAAAGWGLAQSASHPEPGLTRYWLSVLALGVFYPQLAWLEPNRGPKQPRR